MTKKNGSANLQRIRDEIWPEQEKWFEELLNHDLVTGSLDLIKAVKSQVNSGGKRIRAVLPTCVYRYIQARQGESINFNTEKVSKFLGLSLELLHSATLCHDDVMDEDKTRRNSPTVWVSHGIPQAINAGDLLFYLADEAVHRSAADDFKKVLALKNISLFMRKVIHGQALEIELRRDKMLPDLKSYEAVVFGKTGGLFALGLIFGGLLSGLSEAELSTLASLGMDIGRSFQIQDDVLDILGDKGRGFAGSDLWEGKPSWLVVYAANHLSKNQKAELESLLYIARSKKTESDIQRLMDLMQNSGALSVGKSFLENAEKEKDRMTEVYSRYASLIDEVFSLIQIPVKSTAENK